MQSAIHTGRERYFALIEATLREGLARPLDAWTDTDEDTFPLEAALVPLAVRLDGKAQGRSAELIELAAQRLQTASRFVDGSGHQRPPYAFLAVRAFAAVGRSVKLSVESNRTHIGELFAAWSDVSRFMRVSLIPGHAQTKNAMSGTLMLPEGAFETLKQTARGQQPDGTFLPRNASDSLEPQWYDELAILHVLSCYASESGDADVDAAVRRAVRYHAAETQPDHASNHPWAIAAFLAEPDAIPLADMMLHAAGVQQPQAMDAVSLLLLADALDCGRRSSTR